MTTLVNLSTPGQLDKDAAASFERVKADLLKRAGIKSGTTHADQATRPYDRQAYIFQRYYTTDGSGRTPLHKPKDRRPWRGVPYFRRKGYAAAAIPGTSNHGDGNTVDWQNLGDYDTSSWKKADPILREHGWNNEEGERVDEAWHWTYVKANDKHRFTGPFRDVPSSHQFAKHIDWLKKSRITTGYSDGTFRPKEQVSREAMAAFLYRLSGRPSVKLPSRSPFKDVAKNSQFYKEIVWLSQKRITTGYSDGTFRPKSHISREAMAAFLYRAAGRPRFTAPKKQSFKDVSKRTQFHKEIEWLSSQGITTGYDDGTFRPKDSITREATAAFLSRYK